MTYKKELEIAKHLAVISGKKIMDIYNTEFSVDKKADESPLTMADLISNESIVGTLKKEFPETYILSEEEKDDKKRLDKEFVWIIDPLDGTKEFIKKNGEFTVNIALVRNGSPVLGVIYAPVLDELYYASKNAGAFFEKSGKRKKITVSKNRLYEDMTLVVSRSHLSEKMTLIIEKIKFKEIKQKGSSLKGCLVSCGEADVYFRLGPINEWDICAMTCLVSEAGGIITDLKGNEII